MASQAWTWLKKKKNAQHRFQLYLHNAAKQVACFRCPFYHTYPELFFPSLFQTFRYRKIPKIIPSKYKPPQTSNAENPPLNRLSKYKPPGGLYLEIALKYKVKQSKNGKFPSNYKASPIDFQTQISLRR